MRATRSRWIALVLLALTSAALIGFLRATRTDPRSDGSISADSGAVMQPGVPLASAPLVIEQPESSNTRSAELSTQQANSLNEAVAPYRIEGVLLDLSGGRLEDAVVELNVSPRYNLVAHRGGRGGRFDNAKIVAASRTNEDGAFAMGLEEPGSFTLRARSPGFVTKLVEYVVAGPDPVLELAPIRLGPANSFSGRVTDLAGEGIRDARLALAPHGSIPDLAFPCGPGPNWHDLADHLGATAADGCFNVTGFAPGPIRVLVQAAGFASRVFELDEHVWRNRSDVRLPLEPGLAIAGRVLLSPPYRYEQLEVIALSNGGPPHRYLGSAVAANGRFSFEAFAAEPELPSLLLRVLDHGLAEKAVSTDIAVSPGDLDLKVPLFEPVAISFTPVDAITGEFVQPTEVFGLYAVHRRPTGAWPAPEPEIVDGTVRIVMPSPPADGQVGVSVLADGYEGAHHLGVDAGELREIHLGRLPLTPLSTIDVLIMDEERLTPVPGATVRGLLDGPYLGKTTFGGLGALSQSTDAASVSVPRSWFDATAGEDGHAAVPWPEGEEGWLIAIAPGYAASAPFRLEGGQVPAGTLEITLGHGVDLKVSVRSHAGRPIPGLDLSLRRPLDQVLGRAGFLMPRLGKGEASRRTDLDGLARWNCLAPGTLIVTLTDDRGRQPVSYRQELSLANGGEAFHEFVLSKGTTVKGTVLVNGQPVDGLTVLLTREGDPRDPASAGFGMELAELGTNDRTNASGSFELPSIAGGNYVLTIHGSGVLPTPERPVSVWHGMPPTDVEIEVLHLIGLVRTEEGQIPSGTRLLIVPQGSAAATIQRHAAVLTEERAGASPSPQATLEGDGSFELRIRRGIQPIDLIVLRHGYCPTVVPISPLRTDARTMDLGLITLARGGILRVDSTGLGRAFRGNVTAIGPAQPGGLVPRRRAAIYSSVLALHGLTPGPWQLSIEGQLDVAAGQDGEIQTVIEVQRNHTVTWKVR